MEEYQLWSTMNGGLMANAVYQAGVFFLLWVAFRAANQVRAEDADIISKSLVSLFSLGIIFNGLTVGAILFSHLAGTAYGFEQLETISAGAQGFVDVYATGEPNGAQNIFTAIPVNTAWWTVVTIMLFARIWTKA